MSSVRGDELGGDPRAQRAGVGLGVLALLALGGWILASVVSPQFHLLGWDAVWFPAMPFRRGMPWPFFGLDFMYNLAGATTWAHGGDPYTLLEFSFAEPRYVYPPVVLRLFSWSALFGLPAARPAILTWMGLLIGLGAIAAVAGARARRALGFAPLPAALMAALFLGSTPFLFALERGNYDMLVLACIVASVPLLRVGAARGDVAAGALLALAAWMKLYPGLLIVGLVALDRRRAAAAMAGWGLFIGLVDATQLAAWVTAIREQYGASGWAFSNFSHSLTRNWPEIFQALHVPVMNRIPPTLLSGAVLLPLLGFVSWRVFRSPRRAELSLLFLLWIASLATFVPVVSFDYNLVFLALALLVAWDRSLPVWLHVLFAAQLVWMQPFAIPGVEGWLTFWLKLAGVLAVALVLVRLSASPASEVALDAPVAPSAPPST